MVFIGTLVFLYTQVAGRRRSSTRSIAPATMTIVKKTVATGKVIPRREIEVKAQVSGVVEKLYVTAGQTVKKGAIIARIALRPNMLNVSPAEAQLRRARINLQKPGRGPRALSASCSAQKRDLGIAIQPVTRPTTTCRKRPWPRPRTRCCC